MFNICSYLHNSSDMGTDYSILYIYLAGIHHHNHEAMIKSSIWQGNVPMSITIS